MDNQPSCSSDKIKEKKPLWQYGLEERKRRFEARKRKGGFRKRAEIQEEDCTIQWNEKNIEEFKRKLLEENEEKLRIREARLKEEINRKMNDFEAEIYKYYEEKLTFLGEENRNLKRLLEQTRDDCAKSQRLCKNISQRYLQCKRDLSILRRRHSDMACLHYL